jgi:putative DNA primase/helicase
MVLDVPPRIRGLLTDPSEPLWITEGIKKGDSAVTAGLCCIALLGSWSWRGTNADGGKTALADWDDVALEGRVVYIVFDSDAATNKSVRASERRLANYLRARGADVQILRIPPGPDGVKVGLDDWLVGGHNPDELVAAISEDSGDLEDAEMEGGYSCTDDGNALRLVDATDNFRFCPETGRWLHWDGQRWAWDVAWSIRELARKLGRSLKPGDWQTHTLSHGGVNNAIRLASSDARVVVRVADLDAGGYQLNTPSGIVDLRIGTTSTQTPADLVTKITAYPVATPGTPHPRWTAFLTETFGGDRELIGYVQRLLGLSLTGQVTEHVLPFCYGSGANGKSVLMNVVSSLLGVGHERYAIHAPADFLMARLHTAHPTEIARLKGSRFVVCQEVNSDQRFDEARVKELTGGDKLTGRFMRQDFFDFEPTHHLWVAGNHRPEVRDGGPAFWRRVRLIPFNHVVPEADQDRHLGERLLADEGPAILRWLVEGAVAAHLEGIAEPAAVVVATAAYKLDEESVARFVVEECIIGDPEEPQYVTVTGSLREAYEAFCRADMVEPVSAKAFTKSLHELGVRSDRTKRLRLYKGIRFKDDSQFRGETTWKPKRGDG